MQVGIGGLFPARVSHCMQMSMLILAVSSSAWGMFMHHIQYSSTKSTWLVQWRWLLYLYLLLEMQLRPQYSC